MQANSLSSGRTLLPGAGSGDTWGPGGQSGWWRNPTAHRGVLVKWGDHSSVGKGSLIAEHF